jgi:hypothetical protein
MPWTIRTKHDFVEKQLSKDAIDFLLRVEKLKRKSRILSNLREITNEIMSNLVYSKKNVEEQFKKMEKQNVPSSEMLIISRAWILKNKLSKSLLYDLEELLTYAEQKYNDKQK